jgi:hypothetical protein
MTEYLGEVSLLLAIMMVSWRGGGWDLQTIEEGVTV